jgi:hypothetical protein
MAVRQHETKEFLIGLSGDSPARLSRASAFSLRPPRVCTRDALVHSSSIAPQAAWPVSAPPNRAYCCRDKQQRGVRACRRNDGHLTWRHPSAPTLALKPACRLKTSGNTADRANDLTRWPGPAYVLERLPAKIRFPAAPRRSLITLRRNNRPPRNRPIWGYDLLDSGRFPQATPILSLPLRRSQYGHHPLAASSRGRVPAFSAGRPTPP